MAAKKSRRFGFRICLEIAEFLPLSLFLSQMAYMESNAVVNV